MYDEWDCMSGLFDDAEWSNMRVRLFFYEKSSIFPLHRRHSSCLRQEHYHITSEIRTGIISAFPGPWTCHATSRIDPSLYINAENSTIPLMKDTDTYIFGIHTFWLFLFTVNTPTHILHRDNRTSCDEIWIKRIKHQSDQVFLPWIRLSNFLIALLLDMCAATRNVCITLKIRGYRIVA